MSDEKQFHIYKIKNVHLGIFGESFLIVEIAREPVHGERLVGTYYLLTSAAGGTLTRGDFEVKEIDALKDIGISNFNELALSQSLCLASSEIADRMAEAVPKYGAGSVYQTLPKFVEADFPALAGAYMRGLFSLQLRKVKEVCRSSDLQSLLEKLTSIQSSSFNAERARALTP